MKKLLPGPILRRRLASATRHFNLLTSPGIRKKFSEPSAAGEAQLREYLLSSYFPSWYTGVDMERFRDSEAGRVALDNHLRRRLEMSRYGFIPWIAGEMPLQGAKIIEIGCGSGSAVVAMAEQGAKVIGLDLHREALQASRLRASAHGLPDASFIQGNAQDLAELVHNEQFDLIVFYAVLEHMTFEERITSLRAAWELVPKGKYICIADTPNRLWHFDAHSSGLPFFHWLPNEVAFEYSKYSPRYPYNDRFRNIEDNAMLEFIRDGRGVSFHELDLALGGDAAYSIVSDQVSFICKRNPAVLVKRLLAGDRAYERMLNSCVPAVAPGFFRQQLNVLVRKA